MTPVRGRRPRPPAPGARPIERHEHNVLEVGGDRLTVVCVSDTHSAPHPAALEWIEREAPEAIFHLGDIGALSVLEPLAQLAPLYAVRGNIDSDHPGDPPDHRTVTLTRDGEPWVKWLLTHIAIRNHRLSKPVRELAQREGAQLVICGHSHVPFVGLDPAPQGQAVLGIFNPGSIGPRRFRLPIAFGVIALRDGQLAFRHVNCETGADWTPV